METKIPDRHIEVRGFRDDGFLKRGSSRTTSVVDNKNNEDDLLSDFDDARLAIEATARAEEDKIVRGFWVGLIACAGVLGTSAYFIAKDRAENPPAPVSTSKSGYVDPPLIR